MRGAIRICCIAILCIVVCGCRNAIIGPDSIGNLTNELNRLSNQLPQNPATVQPQLAELAQRARAGAANAANPQSKVTYYRIAAIAAWRAGDAAKTEVLDISKEGSTLCGSLPAAQPRPTDCAIIELAAPFAVYESSERQLRGFQQKHAALQGAAEAHCRTLPAAQSGPCLRQPTLLPLDDGGTIKGIFFTLEHQFDDLTKIRSAMENQPAIDNSLKNATDDARATVYCGAVTAWAVFQDADGSQGPALGPLTDRKNRMLCELSFPAAQCEQPSHPQPRVVNCNDFANKRLSLPTGASEPQPPTAPVDH